MIAVRPAVASDRDALVAMRCALWPDTALADHEEDADALLAGRPLSTMPLAVLVATDGAELVGFVEVGLRSHADGCDPRTPLGYVEGWYVAPSHRRAGVGRALIEAAEAWARGHGCKEIASDTWAGERGAVSERAHRALGFEETDRVVLFRKALV